ncbi:ABC-type transport system, permease protein [Candidatus Phytoplasma solani]|uniref:ABC transporter ATP-binding protein/permease n=1 Tax=Candidatus Phytoplasma solani TaxID=69896 RepID=UPI0032DA4948
MFDIKKISKFFTTATGFRTLALNDISLKLPQKGLVFILGKSGSGKSALLNLLGGLDSYEKGDITIKGHSTRFFKQKDLDTYRNGTIGFIFQDFYLIENMSVHENIALALELQGKTPKYQVISNLLNEVEMQDFQNRKINELSGGQKQRVAIIRALIKDPEIILADEPTGNLDSQTSHQVFKILKQLSQERLVVAVSHDQESAYQFGDRVIEFKDGVIISDITKKLNPSKTRKSQFTKGEVLTEEMIKIIQTQQQSPLKENFELTQEVLLETQSTPFKQINSQLPLKKSFKMGTSALKTKKVLLVFSLLILSLTAFMCGMASQYIFYLKDSKKVAIESLEKQTRYKQLETEEKEKLKEIVVKSEEEFLKPLLIFVTVLSLIAFFTIYMYFNASVKIKQKEIGTLRALGAKGSTVSKIFFCEGVVYSSIACVLVFGFTFLQLYLIRNKLFPTLSFFDFVKNYFKDLKSWLLLGIDVVFIFALTFIAIFFPITKLSRKKPIDVLLNK